MINLNKYSDFLLEKMLLLESNVVYSSKFKTILTRMKDDVIAKQLLEIENKDLDIVSNFFDVKMDNDNVVTFTPDKIAQNLLGEKKELVKYVGGKGGWLTNNYENNKEIFGPLGYTPPPPLEDGKPAPVFHPNHTDVGEIISKFKSEKSGKLWCYVKFPKGEGVYNFEKLQDASTDIKATIFNKNRQEIRTGRAIRILLNANGVKFSDAEIEKFVNGFKGILSIMNNVFARFEEVKGDDLGFWYHRKNYLDKERGTLASSCQAVGRLDWLEIYIKNPQTVSCLILRSEENWDKIVGRALIWNLDDGSRLMDYIYTTKDSDVKVFKEYAKNKGWHIRDDEYDSTFVAHINPGEFEKYPSVDTMNRWDPKTGKISNKNFPGSRSIIWTDDGGDDDWHDD